MQSRQFRALVIDDDAAIRELIRLILQRELFEVTTASSGSEAIEMLETDPFDLVVLDLMMPRSNGYEVLRFLNTSCPDTLKRVIVTTASPGLITSEMVLSICHVLPKPFDVDRLAQHARQCVGLESAA